MNKTAEKLKVIIVEDHPIFRKGLGLLIDQTKTYSLAGEADSVPEAMELLKKVAPDIAIIDLGLKDSNGVDLIKTIHTHYRKVKILVISMYDEELYAVRVLRAGAHGYIMKKMASTNTLDALEQIVRGEYYISGKVKSKLLADSIKGDRRGESSIRALTDREFEVFELIARGLDVREIADSLCISRKTIETHRDRIKTKLYLTSAAQLRKYAINWFASEERD